MLTRLELSNFRCFSNHKVELQKKTLLVGKNNAGKSTCVEALRLISVVTERLSGLRLQSPPRWTGLPFRAKGVSPSLEGIEIHRSSLFYNYGDPPAVVSATFENEARLEVHIGPELELHAVIYDSDGDYANSRQSINAAQVPRVSILPQISPLHESEFILEDRYVRTNIQTSRSSLHFRNQIKLSPECFVDLQNLVSTTWPGLAVRPLDIPSIGQRKEVPLSLLVRDGDFEAEVAWMGHGLQMWLQTMWFLVRNKSSGVLILDEPDVYMHADLQRKLIRMLMRDSRQFIVATHSPEMLAEVEPDSVVVLDRKRRISRPATSSQAVQELLLRVGSVHNLSLARLASQRKLLLVEGDDVALLKRVQNIVDPDSDRPIDTVPNIDIGGWGGWPGAVTLARFFRKNVEDDIAIHCFLDRDFHTDEEIAKRLDEANSVGIELTIWSVKELENFFLVPEAIARLIAKKTKTAIDAETISSFLSKEAERRREDTLGAMIECARPAQDAKSFTAAMKKVNPLFAQRWEADNGLSVVGGKELLTTVFQWAQDKHKVSISTASLIHELLPKEIRSELKHAIRSVT